MYTIIYTDDRLSSIATEIPPKSIKMKPLRSPNLILFFTAIALLPSVHFSGSGHMVIVYSILSQLNSQPSFLQRLYGKVNKNRRDENWTVRSSGLRSSSLSVHRRLSCCFLLLIKITRDGQDHVAEWVGHSRFAVTGVAQLGVLQVLRGYRWVLPVVFTCSIDITVA